MALVALGVILVRGLRSPAALADVALAALIGVVIAGYTLVDQQGIRHADALPYLVLLVGIPGAIYLAFVMRRGGADRVRRAVNGQILAGW